MKRSLDIGHTIDHQLQYPELPLDVWKEILVYLPTQEMLQYAVVCKAWHNEDMLYKIARSLEFSQNWCGDATPLQRLSNLSELCITDGFGCVLKDSVLAQLSGTLRSLSLTKIRDVTTEGIKHLTGLTKLELIKTNAVNDDALSRLTSLTILNFHGCKGTYEVNDKGLQRLTNLTALQMDDVQRVTGYSIGKLVSLKALAMRRNYYITDASLSRLTRLETLVIGMTTGILTGAAFETLSQSLKSLALGFSGPELVQCLPLLTNLRRLELSDNQHVQDQTLSQLTGLTSLSLESIFITYRSVACLTNLTELSVRVARLGTMTPCSLINSLPHLQTLYAPGGILNDAHNLIARRNQVTVKRLEDRERIRLY